MADDGLIDAYLAELAVALRWHRHADDILAETADHLRCAVEQRIGDGVDPQAAQREVLHRFGDPVAVARAFATTRSGRLAVPTRSTRQAGGLAYASAGLWLAASGVWHLAGWLYDRLDDGRSATDEVGSNIQLLVLAVMTITVIGAATTLLATLMFVRERQGGFGLVGMVGIGATALGATVSLMSWFLVGWGSLLIVGTALVAVDVWRHGVAPKRATLATGVGLSVGGVAWIVLRVNEVGGPDQFGDYLFANAAGLTIGSVILAAGLFGIGRWLINEEPVELCEPTRPSPA